MRKKGWKESDMVRKGWKKKKLSEKAEIIMGQSPPSKFYNESGKGIPFFQGVTEFQEMFPIVKKFTTKVTKSAKKGDVLMSVRAPVGDLNIANVDCCIGRGLCAIRPRGNKRFIFYLLKANTPKIRSYSGGTTYESINKDQINNLKFDFPECPGEENKIATILSNYDDLIENNTKRIEILEKIAKLIYDEWFVRFRFPGHEKVKFVDSELGKIPEGWEIGKIQDIIKNVKYSIKRSELTHDLIYMPIDVIPRKSMLLNRIKPLSEAQSSLTLFEKGDIVFGSMRSYFHKVILAPFKGITRKTCFTLRAKSQELWSYSYLTLFQESTVAYANQHSKGATIPYAVWENGLANIKIVIPKERILEQFETVLRPILKTIMKTFFKNANLKKTRDLLLPKLVSGEVDVSDLDIKVPKLQEVVV